MDPDPDGSDDKAAAAAPCQLVQSPLRHRSTSTDEKAEDSDGEDLEEEDKGEDGGGKGEGGHQREEETEAEEEDEAHMEESKAEQTAALDLFEVFGLSKGASFSTNSFPALNLPRPLLRACEALGYRKPTPIEIRMCPKRRQTLLFSAMMTEQIDELMKLPLNKPVRLEVDPSLKRPAMLTEESEKEERKAEREATKVISFNEIYSHQNRTWFGTEKENKLLVKEDRDMFGADLDSNRVSTTQSGNIEAYMYKQFQQPSPNTLFTWRKRLFHGMHILPPVRMQDRGDCAYHATVTVMECHFKARYAARPYGQERQFQVRLSHLHLKSLVEEFYRSKEGSKFNGNDRLEVCLLMAKTHGVVNEEDYPGRLPQARRYKIEKYRQLSDHKMLLIPEVIELAETVLTSFRVCPEYLNLFPHEIYRYRRPTVQDRESGDTTGDRIVHDVHCVVLTGTGNAEKVSESIDEDDGTDALKTESYFEYINSYSLGWGVDGFGFIYADSLRKTYRIKVLC